VICFSTNAPVAFADTNVRRVLGRVVLGRTASEREAVEIDAPTMPQRDAARWHHALMDLGATICIARAPRCAICPVFDLCRAKGVDAAPAPRRQTAFATSDRRVRGAIMRALREHGPMTASTLRRRLSDERVPRLVKSLALDGLVEFEGRAIHLPR
jgi:A/G-specific adenine glycosylase